MAVNTAPKWKRKRRNISAAYLHECFSYEPDTGRLVWKARPLSHFVDARIQASTNTKFVGKEAGRVWELSQHGRPSKQAFGNVFIEHGPYRINRVIWALVHNLSMDEVPPTLDHKDVYGGNNALDNLRPATRSQNGYNRRKQGNNTSGFKGVSFDKARGKFKASIGYEKRFVNLGRFDTAEEAFAAYCEAARKYHGEFARTE